jgi:hypothetical protein
MFRKNKSDYKILTPDGYKTFAGIQKVSRDSCRITFESGKIFTCSLDHALCIDLFNFNFKVASKLSKGDKIFGHDGIETVSKIDNIGIFELYDVVGVADTKCYYTD